MALTQRIAAETPEIADILSQTGERYELFRKRADRNWKHPNWQCEAIKKRWPPE